MGNFSKYLSNTLDLIYLEAKVKVIKPKLLAFQKKEVLVAGEKIDLFIHDKSKLVNATIDQNYLLKFLRFLKDTCQNLAFFHLGICYLSKNQSAERKRIVNLAQKIRENAYEIPSSDRSLWLFVGDKAKMPLLEFLPVGKTNDYYADYWLPHVHIDICTTLSSSQIKYATHEIFKGTQRAHPTVVYNSLIYQMRIWLGVVEGINLCLDLKTNLVTLKSHQKDLRLLNLA